MNKEIWFIPVPVVANVSDEEMQEHYDNFFEDVFVECEDKYGEIEEMNVCDNLGDHLVGNVYIKFRREEDAERAVNDLNNRWFGGRPVYAELSPVTDFREACCRQYEMGYSNVTFSGSVKRMMYHFIFIYSINNKDKMIYHVLHRSQLLNRIYSCKRLMMNEIGYLISSLFLFVSENARVPDSATLCTWSPSRVSSAATCTVARRAAGDDLDRVRVHAAEIASGDRDRVIDDRDPKSAEKGTTKVGTADLEDTNCIENDYSFQLIWHYLTGGLDTIDLSCTCSRKVSIYTYVIYYIFIRVINRISVLQYYIIC